MNIAFRICDNTFVLFETDSAPEDCVNFKLIDTYEYKVAEQSLWEYRPDSEDEYIELANQIADAYGIEPDGAIVKANAEEMEEIISCE